MPKIGVAELFLFFLLCLGLAFLGLLAYRIRIYWRKPSMGDAPSPSSQSRLAPMKVTGWAFTGHPNDAIRALWWMGAGLGLVVIAAMLVVLLAMNDGGPIGAFFGIIVGPILGGAMFLCGFAMMPIISIRFGMYKWLCLWLAITIFVGGGGFAGVSYLIANKIFPFR